MESQHLPIPQIFDHEQFGQIRVIMIDDMPWFVAADVCRALDLADVTSALRSLDDDEKIILTIKRSQTDENEKMTPLNERGQKMNLTTGRDHSKQRGGAQFMNVVSEPGLYRLIFQSRKPEAKKFKRWITHEVLPSLRKYGYYALPAQNKVNNPYLTEEKMAAFSRILEVCRKYNDLCRDLQENEKEIRESRTKLLTLTEKRKVLRKELQEYADKIDSSMKEFFLLN